MSTPTKQIAFHTLGCKLNFSETSVISKEFIKYGFEQVKYKEKADIYVINKCDRKDSDKLYFTLSNMLQIVDKKSWSPKIVKTIAIDNIGIEELHKELNLHNNYLLTSNKIKKKNNSRNINIIKSKIASDFETTFWTKKKLAYLNNEVEEDIKKRKSIQYISKKIKSI